MKIYLDSSSLFRLYHHQTGSEELKKFLSAKSVTRIYLSYITKIEFESTVWKKVRTKELDKTRAIELILLFRADYPKFHWVEHSEQTEALALECLLLYGAEGLRTLDSIQLACTRKIAGEVSIFLTEDVVLRKLFGLEGLNLK